MFRRRLGPALVFAGFVVLLDALFWFVAARVLAARSTAWIATQQAQGWTIATGDMQPHSGLLGARLVILRPSVAGGEAMMPGGLTWSADRLVLKVGLGHPLTLGIAAEGQQFLRLSHAPDLGFTAGRAVIRLPFLASTPADAELELMQVSGGIEGSRHPQDVQLDRLRAVLSPVAVAGRAGGQGWRLDIRAGGIGLPDIGYWPLGATINAAGAALVLAAPRLPELGKAGGRTGARTAEEAAAWRDGGGSLALDDINLVWGPLALRGQAELKLNSNLQPAGAGTMDVAGTARALDAASGAGLVPRGVATTASAVLMVMSHVTLREEGREDAQAVRLPFRLHDRTLSVGEIPVVQLPPILWGRDKGF